MSSPFWSRLLAGFDPIDPDLGVWRPRKTLLRLLSPCWKGALTMWPRSDAIWEAQDIKRLCIGHTQHLSEIVLASCTSRSISLIYNLIALSLSLLLLPLESSLGCHLLTGVGTLAFPLWNQQRHFRLRSDDTVTPSHTLLLLCMVPLTISLRAITHSFDTYFTSTYPIPASSIIW